MNKTITIAGYPVQVSTENHKLVLVFSAEHPNKQNCRWELTGPEAMDLTRELDNLLLDLGPFALAAASAYVEQRQRKIDEQRKIDYRPPELRTVLTVLSPDGLPISPKPHATRAKAEAALAKWCQRFAAQGYYSTAAGEHIPLAALPSRCRIE